jgi:tellurite resistance protein TehA-like permease
MSRHPINSLDRIVALQLLPVISTVVAAGAGARIAAVLPDPQRALATMVVCYILFGMGLPLALMILTVYYLRLCLHKLPPREVVVSCFLPLGPLGFGGFTAMQLGKVALALFPRTGALAPASAAGEVAYVLGFLVALVLWGFGMIWLGLALFTIREARPFPFNMGWWGFTFPLGVFAASTLQIGQEMPSVFFDVLGTVFAVSVIMLWGLVAMNTVRGALNGKLFHAPCLGQLPEKYRYPRGEAAEIGAKAA